MNAAQPDAQTCRLVLDVFRDFSGIPVSGLADPAEGGDGVLAQYGTFAFASEPRFNVDLTRQFIKRGEDSLIWQLSCTLEWPASAETQGLGSGELWSFDLEPTVFFAEVPRLAGFDWALRTPQAPQSLAIVFERV